MVTNDFFTLAFQITQDCIYGCEICNRRFVKGEQPLTHLQRYQMIDLLAEKGLKRFTITGGEPMLIQDEVFNLLKYCHDKQIHTCLSTTGHGINVDNLELLDGFLDQLLISVPTLDKVKWIEFYKSRKNSEKLYESVMLLLNNISNTGIILEVCTVITNENKHTIVELGETLLKINPKIVWKVEYYYPMGIYEFNKSKFELDLIELNQIREFIKQKFKDSFYSLYVTEPIRHLAPNIFITPSGEMVKTADNSYSSSLGSVLNSDSYIDFRMNRPWNEYLKYCRNWNW